MLNNEARYDPGARAVWGLKATLKNKISLMAESGMAPPNLHPEPLPDWWPGFMRPDDEEAAPAAPDGGAIEDCGLGKSLELSLDTYEHLVTQ